MTEPVFNPTHILEILAKHRVEHVIIGGIGGVLHGSPMSTDDVDIVPELRSTNLGKLADALNEMGARIQSQEAPEGIKVEFTATKLRKWIVDLRFLNLGTEYGRLDIIHRPGGTTGYQELSGSAETMDLGGLQIRVASLEDIIRSKQAVGRERDLEQLPTLKLVLEKQRSPSIRPGTRVSVPWEFDELRGTVISIRGMGPAARALVRLDMPNGDSEELDFPLAMLSALTEEDGAADLE